jgi:hypothetical protein
MEVVVTNQRAMLCALPEDGHDMTSRILGTGLRECFDAKGGPVDCGGSGQDAELGPGLPWPNPRFEKRTAGAVQDRLTGLFWTPKATPFDFPQTWEEAFASIAQLNADRGFGYSDWRLPNRRELRSLICHGSRKPALPPGHPFGKVHLGWYWTSTTAAIAPAYAWHVHLEGGRMFYGRKDGYCLTWPVRGNSTVLPATGQLDCFDTAGQPALCPGTGQDGEIRAGVPWPEPRFQVRPDGVLDRLTRLLWPRNADVASTVVTWSEGLELVRTLGEQEGQRWRLPTINELESLVDASTHAPALPAGHPFTNVRDGYWSSTTSYFEPDWAYCLYLTKGAVGVGHKSLREFFVWPVQGPLPS